VICDDSATAEAIAAVSQHPHFGYGAILRGITDLLLEEIVGFKNEAFSVEQEWRVVVRRREFLKQGTDDGGKAPLPIYFRPSKGTLVPYVKLIPTESGKKLPVVSVRSGPTLDKAATSMALSMMLTRNGFTGVRVLGSDIPVRFD
jgi:hypothetical protein